MSKTLNAIKAEALQLQPAERGELIGALIDSLENTPDESPDVIAKAWEIEIAQRMLDARAGTTRFIPVDDAMRAVRDSLRREAT